MALSASSSAQVNHQLLPARAGSWIYTATTTGSEAAFADASRQSLVSIRCTRAARRVAISVRSAPAASMLVWTSTTSRSLAASHNPATGLLTAELAASDPLLDAIVFSRGRFSVTAQGASALVVPSWAEPARAIEDCRN